jgi:ComF family protein
VRTTVAAYRYTGVGRDLLRTLKFHRRSELAPALGRALAARVERELPDLVGACAVAVVAAVPIHWTRRLARGFNQAELIGRACARELGLPFEARALGRRRRTRALFTVKRGDRAEELEGAIRARSDLVAGRWVLLVDDIRTSGASLATCGRALRAAGAVRVDAAVVGR